MITKERLEELINQGATVYRTYADVCVQEYKLNKDYFEVDNAYLWKKIKNGAVKSCGYPLEQLFEIKEEANEYLEFGNVTRTEKLELPTWKEIKDRFDKKQIAEKYFYYAKHFLSPNTTNVEDTYSIYLLINGVIAIDDDVKCKTLFSEQLTKENYDEARRLCVKLFKGESV